MASPQTIADVQKAYVAFYQRPADPAGLAYWSQQLEAAKGNLQQMIDPLANSPEAARLYFPSSTAGQSLYSLVNATTISDVVTQIYQNLLGRAPDAAGLQYYVDGFKAATFTPGTIALAVINGVQNSDLSTMNAKLAVAQTFSEAVDGRAATDAQFGTGTLAATYAGDPDALAARGYLQTQTSTAQDTAANVAKFVRHFIAEATDPIVTKAAIAGGPGNELSTGTPNDDLFLSSPGNDTIVGLAGNDHVFTYNLATDGSDEINLGTGNDSIQVLSPGASQIRLSFANSYNNVASGTGVGSAADAAVDATSNTIKIQAEDGTTDALIGNIGYVDDEGITLYAGPGTTFDVRSSTTSEGDQFKVAVVGTSDAELLDYASQLQNYFVVAGLGNDTINGGSGNDYLIGHGGDDLLVGNAGNDTLVGSGGNDTLLGGAGNDRVFWNGLSTRGFDEVNLGAGNDRIDVNSVGAVQIRLTFTSANVGNGTGLGTQADTANTVKLQAEDGTTDTLTGNIGSADDEGTIFVAGNGATFDVRDVSGTQRGSHYTVAILGSAGDDLRDFSTQTNSYYANGGQGNDTVLAGSGNDFLVGGAGSDSIVANGGDDTLLGGAGADTLSGSAGNDVFVAGQGASGLSLATADTLTDFLTGADRLSLGVAANATNLVLATTAVTDFAAALSAANAAFAADAGGNKAYVFQFDGTNGYLFIDWNADGTSAEEVIILGGANRANALAMADISA